MNDNFNYMMRYKNYESPFTKLLPLLIKHDFKPNGAPALAYEMDKLLTMSEYIDNANNILLQGLQDMGKLVSQAARSNKGLTYTENLGDFICAVSNLIEALNCLRQDVDFGIKQCDY